MELAHRGSLFLDEIGDLPLPLQAKLLRVIENRVGERVGAVQPLAVDFRLVAATNKDLGELIQAGKFREDLYYRLGSMVLNLPPLGERREDIPLLVEYFIRKNDRGDTDISYIRALKPCKGNQSKSARRLGISRLLLYNQLKLYGIYPVKLKT